MPEKGGGGAPLGEGRGGGTRHTRGGGGSVAGVPSLAPEQPRSPPGATGAGMSEDKSALGGADGGKYPPSAWSFSGFSGIVCGGGGGGGRGGQAGKLQPPPRGWGGDGGDAAEPPGQAGKGRACGWILFTELRTCVYSRDLDLKKPLYQRTAAYGHFGRDSFPWEVPKKLKY